MSTAAIAAMRPAREVVEGRRFFYSWRGSEPATVSVARGVDGRWRLDECRGPRNQPVTAGTREAVEAAVREWLRTVE